MRRLIASVCILCGLLLCTGCSKSYKAHYKFDSSYEVAGAKFALKDINPDLPADWDEFNYVVLEYKITTSQRFQLGFTTESGYNELRVMSYVPKAWNKLAIPLKYFTSLPDPAFDVAASFNKPRYTGWINLGGKRGPLHGVDSIGFRILKPIGSPEIFVRNVTLSVEDPGDEYMEKKPAIDRFGQSTAMDYPEKVGSLEELEAQWRAEESEEVGTAAYNWSQFGGFKNCQVEGTGFFRIAQIDGKWWFVDPEGYLFLSVGVDCVSPGNGGTMRDYDKRPGMYEALPPDSLAYTRNGEKVYSLGTWNQVRRFGADWRTKANELIIKRMDKWGLNTIANWSDPRVMNMQKKAFTMSLNSLCQDGALMGLADVYAPDFQKNIEASVSATVADYVNNPWVIGYFFGNEPAWVGSEVRLCQIILDGADRPVKTALEKFLKEKGDTEANRTAFILDCFDKFLGTVNGTLKKCDPNHINLGMRFANPDAVSDELLRICGKHFDVFSFNAYMLAPGKEMLDRAYALTGSPMIVGEYHFGTVDRGLAQTLWQVDSEEEKGRAYRYYTEQAYSHPAFIGTGYFQWSDQDITGRFDGENYSCGLVDVTDRPYGQLVNAISETSKRLYDVHNGTLEPFDSAPASARGYGLIPDLWNK